MAGEGVLIPSQSALSERQMSLNKISAGPTCALLLLLLLLLAASFAWRMPCNEATATCCHTDGRASACITGCMVAGRRLQQQKG